MTAYSAAALYHLGIVVIVWLLLIAGGAMVGAWDRDDD